VHSFVLGTAVINNIFSKGIEYLVQSLVMAKKVRDRGVEGRSYANLGNSYDSLGDYSKAIKYFTHHLAIAQEVDNRAEEHVAYRNLGGGYNSLMHFLMRSSTTRRPWRLQRR
jgi:tetratricopeptide (TPR) repeat protein